MFLGFLFLVVQVTVHLFASSTAAATALEAASRAARSPHPAAVACARSEAWAAGQLAGWPGVRVSCRPAGDQVRVRVAGTSPAATMRVVTSLTGLDTIVRDASVRREELR